MESHYSFSVSEYAQRHSVSQATVFRWLKAGMLNSVKVGHLRRITIDNEQEFLTRFAANGSGGHADE